MRRLGPRQLTTDTAVLFVQMVLEKGFTLADIPYIDDPRIPTGPKDVTVMPFRYLVHPDRRPRMAPGMLECLSQDMNLLAHIKNGGGSGSALHPEDQAFMNEFAAGLHDGDDGDLDTMLDQSGDVDIVDGHIGEDGVDGLFDEELRAEGAGTGAQGGEGAVEAGEHGEAREVFGLEIVGKKMTR
jgi:hypothetical protein